MLERARTLLLAGAVLSTVIVAACSDSNNVPAGGVPVGTTTGGTVGGGSGGTTTGGTVGGGTTGGGTTGGILPLPGVTTFLNVIPPGSNGNSAGGVGAPVPGAPVVSYPKNFTDQLALYGDLSYAKPNLVTAPCNPPTDSTQHVAASDQACNYYKHEGLTPDVVVSTETLTANNGKTVTIKRDGWGVPFVEGADRASAEYGFGYASAEDRLWLYDVLRNIGRGQLSKFLGPAPSFYDFDVNLATVAGYNEDELTQMVAAVQKKYGTLGDLFATDIDAEVAGINAYIASLSGANASKVPPEYASLKPGGFPPANFTRNDIVASAILIQSIFAVGGGTEHLNELLLQRLDPAFTAGSTTVSKTACEFWRDVRHAEDPEAPVTIDTRYETQSPALTNETCPQTLPAGAAIWDNGSFKSRTIFSAAGVGGLPSVPAKAPGNPPAKSLNALPGLTNARSPGIAALVAQYNAKQATSPARAGKARKPEKAVLQTQWLQAALDPVQGARDGLTRAGFGVPNTMSNWIGVNGNLTKSGHPIVVMGPQTSYFVPQLLSEIAVKSNGGTPQDFDGRGIAFANLPYIEIGRAESYAWSATSGESDLIDIRVSKLCNIDGSAASRDDANADGFPDADGYLYDAGDGKGAVCRRLFKRTDSFTAVPTPASLASNGPATPQTVTRYILRTHYGPVFATALVGGAPVVISQQRSTFFNELDTAPPFALAATHVVHDAKSFQQLFNSISGTFNWLYVDSKDIGYIHTGLYPKRATGIHTDLPSWGDGRYEWTQDAGKLDTAFFAAYGGTVPFPGRVTAQAQGDPLLGYFEYQDFLPLSSHPQAINPERGFIDSWNNKPAVGWWAADGNGTYGPTHRVSMLADRVAAFKRSGTKFDFGNMVEIEADAAYTDLRGQAVLPLLLQLMKSGTLTDDQKGIVTLMQGWIDVGSNWIPGLTPGNGGLGAWRRDRDDDGIYDQRSAVVLMDAWYPHLIDSMLPQLVAQEGFIGQGRYDAPRAQGSAYQEGWFEHMKRVLETVLDTPGHPRDYKQLKCADGTAAGCRAAVLSALDLALTDLGGYANRDTWDGSTLPNAKGTANAKVEDYDAVEHTDLSLLPVVPIRWINRPTFQQVVEIAGPTAP